jgi:hypothetical protein
MGNKQLGILRMGHGLGKTAYTVHTRPSIKVRAAAWVNAGVRRARALLTAQHTP